MEVTIFIQVVGIVVAAFAALVTLGTFLTSHLAESNLRRVQLLQATSSDLTDEELKARVGKMANEILLIVVDRHEYTRRYDVQLTIGFMLTASATVALSYAAVYLPTVFDLNVGWLVALLAASLVAGLLSVTFGTVFTIATVRSGLVQLRAWRIRRSRARQESQKQRGDDRSFAEPGN